MGDIVDFLQRLAAVHQASQGLPGKVDPSEALSPMPGAAGMGASKFRDSPQGWAERLAQHDMINQPYGRPTPQSAPPVQQSTMPRAANQNTTPFAPSGPNSFDELSSLAQALGLH